MRVLKGRGGEGVFFPFLILMIAKRLSEKRKDRGGGTQGWYHKKVVTVIIGN